MRLVLKKLVASFRTAQKSGFRLIDKRIDFVYYNRDCNLEDFNTAGGSCYYYFQKFNMNREKIGI